MPGRRSSKALLNGWWTLWVVHLVLSAGISWFNWYTGDASRAARGFLSLYIANGLIALAAAVLAILVVRRLTGWQERRLAR